MEDGKGHLCCSGGHAVAQGWRIEVERRGGRLEETLWVSIYCSMGIDANQVCSQTFELQEEPNAQTIGASASRDRSLPRRWGYFNYHEDT